MGDSHLDLLRRAAELFASPRAVSVYKRPSGRSIWFRVGYRDVVLITYYNSEDCFGVDVHAGLVYEGSLRLKVALVKEMIDGDERKSLLIEADGYYMSDGKRHPMSPGPAYSLLALGTIISSFSGFFLYGVQVDLDECKRVARKLLNDINAAAEVPKTHDWEDNPDLLDNMIESYIYLVVWILD